MRIWTAILTIVIAISCSTGSQYQDKVNLVEKLFIAGRDGDSIDVRALSEPDVPARLIAMRAQMPQLFAAAANGLEVAKVRYADADSIYFSLRPKKGNDEQIIDVGLSRTTEGWKIYYLTIPSRM